MKSFNLLRIVFISIFIALCCIYIPKVTFENSFDKWIPANNQEVSHYKDFLKNFGGDAILTVTFELIDTTVSTSVNKYIDNVIKASKELPGVKRVFRWPSPLFKLNRKPAPNTRSIVIVFSPSSPLNPNRPQLLAKVKDLIQTVPAKSHIAGTGVLTEAINNESRKSTIVFLSIGISVLLCLLLLLLKNVKPFLATISVAVGGVCSLLICAGLLNISISLLSVILPVLILFYSTSNSLHILFHKGNFREVITPCALTALTTSCSFIAFLFDPIPLFRDFSFLAVSGITGGFLWAIVLFFPKTIEYAPRKKITSFFNHYKIPLRLSTLPVLIIISIVMIPGLLRLKTDILSLRVISKSDISVKDHHYIEDNVCNYIPLEYVVDVERATTREVNNWIKSVNSIDRIDGWMSYTGFPSFLNPQNYGYLSEDSAKGRVTFLVPLLSTSEGVDLVHKIDSLSEKIFTDDTPVKATGYVTLYGRIAHEILSSFKRSISIAFSLIFLILLIYIRNSKIFLSSLFPNIFPILIIFGIMGWFNIYLDMVTVPIGCLLLGIVVDDTIHFLYWYKKTDDIHSAFRESAPGIMFTSITLISGFSILILSHSPPTRFFGLLSIIALLAALIGDLVLLPLILKLIHTKE